MFISLAPIQPERMLVHVLRTSMLLLLQTHLIGHLLTCRHPLLLLTLAAFCCTSTLLLSHRALTNLATLSDTYGASNCSILRVHGSAAAAAAGPASAVPAAVFQACRHATLPGGGAGVRPAAAAVDLNCVTYSTALNITHYYGSAAPCCQHCVETWRTSLMLRLSTAAASIQSLLYKFSLPLCVTLPPPSSNLQASRSSGRPNPQAV
jgi:hypothetical protein